MLEKSLALTVLSFCLAGCEQAKRLGKVGDFCSEDKDCEQGLCFESKCLDPDKDDDNDGLKNGVEVHMLHTNPLKADSDDDGVWDAEEVGTIENPNDTDGDGKIDAIESTIKDQDKDCIADQYDPQDDVPDQAKLSEVAMKECQKDTGVCAGHLDKARARCEDGRVVCYFPEVEGFEEVEKTCDDGIDNDCDGVTDVDCVGLASGKILVLVRDSTSLDSEEQKVVDFLQQNGYEYDIADSALLQTMPVPSYKVIYFCTGQEPTGYNNQTVLQAIRSAVESGSSLFVEYYGCYLAQYLGWGTVSTSSWYPAVHDTSAYVKPITTHPIFAGIPTWDPPALPDRPEQVLGRLQQPGRSYNITRMDIVDGSTQISYWVMFTTYGWPYQKTDSEYCKQWGGCTGERSVFEASVRLAYHGAGRLVVLDSISGSSNAPFEHGPAGLLLIKNIINWAAGR